MDKHKIFNETVNYLKANNYGHSSMFAGYYLIKINHDENYATDIKINSNAIDFIFINHKNNSMKHQITLNNTTEIIDDIIFQIKISKEYYYTTAIKNTNNIKDNNTIKLELTINLAPEETNFENIFYNPNDPADDDSKYCFFNNTLNVDNLKLYSRDIGDYVGKITGVKIL